MRRLMVVAICFAAFALLFTAWQGVTIFENGAPGDSQAPGAAPPRTAPSGWSPPAVALPALAPSPEVGADGGAAAQVADSADAAVDLLGLASQVQREALEVVLKSNASKAERSLERFCDENQRLAAAPLFPKKRGDRDAAAFMAPRIDWEEGVRPQGLLHLAEPLRARIRATGSDWPTQLGVADTEGLDFSWLQALSGFDVWTVATYGPLRDDPSTGFFNAQIPNYMSLLEWVKLRFVRALAVGDQAAASAEVRQLAALIQTSGLVISDAIAGAILKLDLRAREAAAAAGRDLSGWPALDPEQLARFRRVALVGPYMFAPGVPEAVVKKASACAVSPCSALTEGLGMQLSFGKLPGIDSSAALEEAVRNAPCSPLLFERVRKFKPTDPAELLKELSGLDRFADLFGDGGVPR